MSRTFADHPMAAGCLAMLGMPVTAGGILLLVQAGSGPAATTAVTVAGIACSVLGGLLILASARSVRAGKRELLRREEFPAQPWRWREDWATGTIPASRRAPSWLIVAAIGIMSAAIAVAVDDPRVRPLAALCAAALVLTSARPVRRWARSARIGHPPLQLHSFPGVLGERLRATVALPPAQTGESFSFLIRCVREGDGFLSQPRAAAVLWSAKVPLAGHQLPTGGIAASIELPLPESAPISERSIRWDVALVRTDGETVISWEIPVFASVGSEG